MHIINFDNFEISLTEEAFYIKPIRDLFNADRTKGKEKFLQQMSVIYFLVDPRSSYNYIIDDEERFNEIKIQEGLPNDFKIDKKLQEAIDIYKKHIITTSYLLLQDTKIAVERVRQFLRNIDLNAVDDKGKPMYTINSVTTAIKQIPQLAKDLADAEKMITKEIEETGRARGGNERKKLFEDGVN
jgi:hypothetical protein